MPSTTVRRTLATRRALSMTAICCAVVSAALATPPPPTLVAATEATPPTQSPPATPPRRSATPEADELAPGPTTLEVQPVARDDEIRGRLQSVLDATGWFTDPQVRVENGVVFLEGIADTEELRRWAGDLARNTQDVAAVANSIEIAAPPPWDFSQVSRGIAQLWRDILHALPNAIFALAVLALAAIAGLLVTRLTKIALRRSFESRLLRSLISRAAGIVVLLIGTYIVLRIAGLTQLALTVVGGTGLIGLALGIAFRDITENYLASIFLSVQRPFAPGDLIEVAGVSGYVQQLNVRTTVLMAIDGNIVEIPNAAVYKSTIRNFTANPNRCESFVIGIATSASIEKAQDLARGVLDGHPAVLADPEPSVLAERISTGTIDLRVRFWINGRTHGPLKVRSAMLRLINRAFRTNGVVMPDALHQIVFPDGVAVSLSRDDVPAAQRSDDASTKPASDQSHPLDEPDRGREQTDPSVIESDQIATQAEGGLTSDADVLQEQARQAKPLDDHADLLPPQTPPTPDTTPSTTPSTTPDPQTPEKA